MQGGKQQRGEEAALVAEKHASSEPAGATAEDGVSGSSDDDGNDSIVENDDNGSTDEDEEQLLSRRASWSSKHELPQPSAPARSRQNRFPKIPKSARCGMCENCLNPQRKKACIVARQRMLQQAGGTTSAASQRRSTPASATAHATAPARAAPAAGAAAAEDPFTRNLTSILSSSGGVAQDRHLPLLLQLVKRARSKPHRTALLAVLQLSAPEVLRQAVAGGLLLELQAWLGDFVAEEKQAMVQRVLGCLNKLPVTLTALQPPCELGKMVGRLRKLESFGSPVIEPAKRLVARWKAMVDQAVKGSQSGSAAAPSGMAVAGEAAGRSAAAIAAAKPSSGVAAGAGLDRQSSGGAAGAGAMDDGDLFKSADRQRAGIKEAVPLVKKTVTIKTLPVEATRGLKPAAAGQPAAQQAAGAQADGPAGVPERANISKVSASPFASLGSMSSLGSGVTMLGSSSGGLHRVPLSTVGLSSSTAKDRAAAAARRVPSPEPGPCKQKKKKVVWVEEEVLTAVRWFRKDDPPAAAKADADLSKAGGGGDAAGSAGGGAAAHEASPPGFESAAKQEHLSEAEALRRHREEEDEERSELDNRLALMVPTTAWLNPLPNDTTSGAELDAMSAPPACGEDSAEAQAAAARHEQVPAVKFDSLAAVPDCPAEPTTMAEHGVVQHLSTIPRIPLSLEEAATMRPPEAQQQISASQPPVQVPAQQQAKQQQQQQQQQQPPQQPPQHQQQHQHQHGGGQAAAQQELSQLEVQTRQHLQQQQSRQQAPPPGPGVGDISAALAQLAASGILHAVKGGMTSRAAPEQQQMQQLAPPYPQQQQQQGAPPAARPPLPGMPLPPPGPPPRGQPSPLHGHHPMQQRLRGQPPPPPGMPPPGHPGAPRHPQIPSVQQRPVSNRPCRYFSTPQGCYMGDRCNFAHLLPPGSESGRGRGASGKRPPDGDVGRPGKQQRGASWGGGRP